MTLFASDQLLASLDHASSTSRMNPTTRTISATRMNDTTRTRDFIQHLGNFI